MDFHKITKITLWSVFGAIFALSLYFNYLYINEKEFHNLTDLQEINTNYNSIDGRIISISDQNISIDNNGIQGNIIYSDSSKITISKINIDTLEPEIVEAKISDLSVGKYILVKYDNANNEKLAREIQILFANMSSRSIISVNNKIIKIKSPNNIINQPSEFDINIDNNTKYYTGKYNKDEMGNIKFEFNQSSFENLKIDNEINIVFKDDLFTNDNQIADKIIIIESN